MRIRFSFVTIAIASLSTQVFAASFPCHKASTYGEVAVCSDSELSRQDEELAVLYQEALARLPDPKMAQREQRNWLKEGRDQCRTVQCVRDAYTKRIDRLYRDTGERPPYGSERSQPTRMQPSRPQAVAVLAQLAPSDEDCAKLNAAITTALNSKIPATSLTQFGGRVVTGWRQSDYDTFLGEVNACNTQENGATEIGIFTEEALALLTALRQRAVRIEPAVLMQSSAEPTEAQIEEADAVATEGGQAIDDWENTSNAHGVVMTSKSRNVTIYLGEDCDAMSPQYGEGIWSFDDTGWVVKVGTQKLSFSRILPPIRNENGDPPQKCVASFITPQIAATPQASVAPLLQPPAVQQLPPISLAPVVATPPVARPAPTLSPAQMPAPVPSAASQNGPTEGAIGNFLVVSLVVWLSLVLIGIIAGFKGAIVVYRNYDDLAMVFFMGVILFVGGLVGFYLSGFKGSFATPVVWGLSGLGIICLFGWTLVRTWRDQQPESVWRFALALITKMSIGILFVNNLVTLISPSGKTFNARSRARSSALLFLAVLTPIVMRLVRDHEGVWAPRNLLNVYQRRRLGL